jgi:hypothetical protein
LLAKWAGSRNGHSNKKRLTPPVQALRPYHLVHHDPVRLRDALSWSLDHLKVEGVAVCDTQVEKDIAMKVQTPLVHRLQRRIDVVHDAYVPYCTTEPRFQMEAASRHLGRKFSCRQSSIKGSWNEC